MRAHVARCSRKFLDEGGSASQQSEKEPRGNAELVNMDNLAVVSALSRPLDGAARKRQGKRSQSKGYNSKANKAARAARKESVQFLLHGSAKQALAELALGIE